MLCCVGGVCTPCAVSVCVCVYFVLSCLVCLCGGGVYAVFVCGSRRERFLCLVEEML